MSNASSPRWEWAGTPQASEVPKWMRPGHGPDGAMHAALLHLVRARESADRDPDHAFRPLAEIHQEAVEWRGFTSDDTRRILEALVPEGLTESRSQHPAGEDWRATPAAVQAVNAAYATRHPLTEDGPA